MTVEEPPVDPLQAIGKAAESAAKKDELTSSALTMFKRSWRFMAVAVVVALGGISYGAWQAHDNNARGAKNTPLLVCVANSQQDVAKDIRTLIASKAKAPQSAYKIPAACQLVP